MGGSKVTLCGYFHNNSRSIIYTNSMRTLYSTTIRVRSITILGNSTSFITTFKLCQLGSKATERRVILIMILVRHCLHRTVAGNLLILQISINQITSVSYQYGVSIIRLLTSTRLDITRGKPYFTFTMKSKLARNYRLCLSRKRITLSPAMTPVISRQLRLTLMNQYNRLYTTITFTLMPSYTLSYMQGRKNSRIVGRSYQNVKVYQIECYAHNKYGSTIVSFKINSPYANRVSFRTIITRRTSATKNYS